MHAYSHIYVFVQVRVSYLLKEILQLMYNNHGESCGKKKTAAGVLCTYIPIILYIYIYIYIYI